MLASRTNLPGNLSDQTPMLRTKILSLSTKLALLRSNASASQTSHITHSNSENHEFPRSKSLLFSRFKSCQPRSTCIPPTPIKIETTNSSRSKCRPPACNYLPNETSAMLHPRRTRIRHYRTSISSSPPAIFSAR